MNRRNFADASVRFYRFVAVILGLFQTVVWAAPTSEEQSLPDFDNRRPATVAVVAAEKGLAAAQLRARLRHARVEMDPVSESPKFVDSPDGFLTSVAGEGRAMPRARTQSLRAGEPHRELKAFLQEYRGLFGHGAEALAEAQVKRDYTNKHNGLRSVVWQQQVDGVPVFGAVLQSHLTKRGELVNVASQFLANPVLATERGTPRRAGLLARPTISAAEAVATAGGNIGEAVQAAALTSKDAAQGAEKKQSFQAAQLRGATVHLAWLPMDKESARLCWDVVLTGRTSGEMFRILVDAATGEAHLRHCLTNYISEASYRVFTGDSPTPFNPGHATPSTGQPPQGARTLVTLGALDTTASPNGWIDDGVNETRGNNVDAHLDLDANNIADTPRPQGSPNRVFDFPLDLTQAPSAYRSAAVTQLFYLCNWMHDKLYQLGFTEAAGNFQVNNFGRGGTGNDAVQAEAQDGGGTNNANFSTPPDGSAGLMQMYVFTGPTPDRDGDFDAQIVLHEYAHGLSNRLVGGGVGLSALASRGMGEGWSDFYGLALLSKEGNALDGNYVTGGYATLNFSGLTENHYYGIRRYPYSTNLAKNPLTFRDIDPTQASTHAGIPRSPIIGNSASEVHNSGEVWCVTLWEARSNLITKHGFAIGNQLILQLVTDGMKLAPPNPNFLQARDAIIQADLVNNAGANQSELWAAFAKRGMGASATAPASTTTTGLVESYDLPDSLRVTPPTGFTSSGPVGGPFNVPSTTYSLTNDGAAALSWIAAITQPWLTLSAASGTLAAGATTTVTVSLNDAADALTAAIYNGSVTFTNTVTTRSATRPATLLIGQPDYFTELFDSTPNDTANQTFTFSPNGSADFYAPSRLPAAAFPSDTTTGTALTLTDDSAALVAITGGQSVKLYGTSYTSFYVGSNGYITFGSGDSSYTESFDAHFLSRRIAAHMRDLNPGTAGTVRWKQFADRVAVTWLAVPEYGTLNSNNFQIEMFFDGNVRITILGLASTHGLIGLSRGTGTPVGFAESDFSTYPLMRSLSVALPASAVEGAGVLLDQGTVTLSQTMPADVTVALTSSDPVEVTVPASVTIPAGQLSAIFSLTVLNDAIPDGTQAVTVSASAALFLTGSRAINVADDETATLALTVPASATEGAGPVTGTVSMAGVAGKAVTVQLTSNDLTEATVPAAVVIPAGQSSVTFPVTIVNDTAIDGPQTATITASVENWTANSQNISVFDNESLALSLSLTSVSEGGTATGTVSIAGTRSTDLTVTLLSANTARLTLPASATILAGSTSATFTETGVNNALTDGSQAVTVTASAAGFTSGSGSLTVLDNDVHHLGMSGITGQIRGVPFNVTITAQDINNVIITSFAGPVTLNASGGVPITPANAAFTAGIATVAVTANAFGTGITLTATDALGHAKTSNAFNVTFGSLHHFAWSPVAAMQFINTPFAVTLTAQDTANNTVGNFAGTAALTCGLPPRAVGPGTGTWDFPLHTYYHDARTQVIYPSSDLGAAGQITALSLYVETLPGQPMAAWTIRLKPTSLNSYGTSPAWESTGWTVVHQSTQTISTAGWVKFVFSTPFNYNGVGNLLVDFSFNNSSYSTSGTSRMTPAVSNRAIYYNTDSGFGDPLSWSGSGGGTSPTPLASVNVPNLLLDFVGSVPVNPATTGNFVGGVWSGAVSVGQLTNDVALFAASGPATGQSSVFDVAGIPVLAVAPSVVFTSAGDFGGPFTPASQDYTLTNTGAGPMTWTAAKTAAWLILSPANGTLAPGGSITVTASLDAALTDPGTHTDTVTFTNASTGLGNSTRQAVLTVTLPPPTILSLPTFTGGTTATIAWLASAGATLFEAQGSPDPGFGTPASSGFIAGSEFTFSGLSDGPHFYRVRARRINGATVFDSAWSPVLTSHQSTTGPAVIVTSARSSLLSVFTIEGLAFDPAGITSLTLNGTPAETTDGFAHWRLPALTLAPGNNVFVIEAVNTGFVPATSIMTWNVYHPTMSSDFDRDGLPDAWENQSGLDLFDDSGSNGALGDLSGNGIPNLLKYAFGLDPRSPDLTGLPAVTIETDPGDLARYLVLRYRRLITPGPLEYVIEFSSDLTAWTSTAADFMELAPAVQNPDGLTETVTVRVLPALTTPAAAARYLRLQVRVP